MNKIVCDYCNEEILDPNESNIFTMPEEEEITFRGGIHNSVIHKEIGVSKSTKDICWKCQKKIAKFTKISRFINMDILTIQAYREFYKEFINKISNGKFEVTK